VTQIRVSIRQHPAGSPTSPGGSDYDRNRAWQRPRGQAFEAFLSPSQKYEIWLQLIRQEVTIAEAAEQQRVYRSTIVRIRTVAKEGALAARAASKPGVTARECDYELELAKAEVARLSEAVTRMGVKLTLVGGKGGRAARPARGGAMRADAARGRTA
jgi:transposase